MKSEVQSFSLKGTIQNLKLLTLNLESINMIHHFTNDYSEGCHPSILETLSATNLKQQEGYGEDEYCLQAAELIRTKIGNASADVHFVAGGTIANTVVLAAILKPFESAIAATTGHINTHETGAIEATGHKVEEAQTKDGKLTPAAIQPILDRVLLYHTVRPKVVYISNSTETGAIYSKQELAELSAYCKANNLYLYIDGARLASALTAAGNDLTLKDMAAFADAFYIGGTKCGALLGEAIVILNDQLKPDFRYHIKQRGAMMAKGRLLGIQFMQLLKDDLMFELAAHSNKMAEKLATAIRDMGYPFLTEPASNQIFPILPNEFINRLQKNFGFEVWEAADAEHSVVRFVTSWATPESAVDALIEEMKS
jgi:threonine aldolase